MSTLPFSKIRSFVIIIALLLLAGGTGYRLGEHKVFDSKSFTTSGGLKTIINTGAPANTNVDFAMFWDVWQRLFTYYIESSALDKQKMVWGAISGMVNSLDDPYTVFLPPKENSDFKEDLGGQFEGIGAQLGLKEGRVMVISPLKGNPAEKAGIRSGDFILKVNDEDTTGWTLPEAVSKIRGKKGTTVKLNILHEGEMKASDITVTRDEIRVPSVESWIKTAGEITEITGVPGLDVLRKNTGKVGYIRLTRFGDNSNQEWLSAVDQLVQSGIRDGRVKGLIFDLRGNPGGYLQGAVFIASEFISKGTIVTQENSDGTKEDYPVDRNGRLTDVPVIVLIDKGSASAAEIVAGALRDYKRARLVGEQSFGKGSVQTPMDLKDGAGLHITTGKWLLPNGDSINKTGIIPEFEVKLDSPTASADAQLAKAVELLLQ